MHDATASFLLPEVVQGAVFSIYYRSVSSKWDLSIYTRSVKNETEKNYAVQLINNWEKTIARVETLAQCVNKLLSLREELTKLGFDDLKFKAEENRLFVSEYNYLKYLYHFLK